jgi:signal transduction histidine kinase/ligand-binding sensor domain-containing protein
MRMGSTRKRGQDRQPRGQHFWWSVCLGWLFLLSFPAQAQYPFDHWTADNGLPQNSVRDIVQTRDGYLWLATLDGLVRFDGVHFTVFNKGNSPGIISNRFIQLYEDGDGDLWAGTESSGLARLHEGRFTTYTTVHGLPNNTVTSLGGDGQGRLLLFVDAQPWCRVGERFQPVAMAAAGKIAERDMLQHLAYGSANQTYSFSGAGQGRSLKWTDGAGNLGRPMQDRQGHIWFGSRAGLYTEVQGQLRRSLLPGGGLAEQPTWMVTGRQPLQAISSSADGGLWLIDIETHQRQLIARLPPALRREFPAITGELFMAYGDREGNLWLGTLRNGLYRLRKQVVTIYGEAQGLTRTEIYPIYEDRTGTIWIGSTDGLYRFQDGVFTSSPHRPPPADHLIHSIYEDHAGRIWANGRQRLVDGRLTLSLSAEALPLPIGTCYTMHEDLEGAFWFGTDRGVVRYKDGVRTHFTTKDGLAGDDTKVIIGDGAGGLWLGSYGGLTHFKDGRFNVWTERDGLPGNTVRSLRQDSDGTLWIGTYDSGLGRFKNGRFTRYTTKEGIFDNGVFQILEDDFGWVWMSCNRGIYRVRKRELNDFADGKSKIITSVAFGKSDGMENVECNGGRWPAGIKARDGRLWFPTMGGVAVIDPATVATNAQPPPVVIEAARIDNQEVTAELLQSSLHNSNVALRLTPRQNNFEIQYTALSFINAENLRFKYMLEGLDQDWVDAGTRRTAYFSHVAPGSYTFKVIAANSDGIWNTEGKSLRITVLPPFYRTWWFLSLAAVTVIGAVFATFKYRGAQMERQQAVQQAFARQLIESQEQERQRIAAELHDSLGQNLLIIKNHALLGRIAAENGLGPQGQPEFHEQFDQIVDSATQSIEEVRHIAHNLRPYHLDRLGLTQALDDMIEKVAASTTIRIVPELLPLDGFITKEASITLYRIVQECLNNIVKHSQADEARISIERQSESAVITIRDNGRGFAPKAGEAKVTGFGLTGMAERVRMLGGDLVIHSAPGQGTTVNVRLKLTGSSNGGTS